MADRHGNPAEDATAFVVVKHNCFGKAATLDKALAICNAEVGSRKRTAAHVWALACDPGDVELRADVGLWINWPDGTSVIRFTANI